MKRDAILPAALALPKEERAKLARELLRSLDGPRAADADRTWLAEIERRIDELADGSVEAVEWDDVRERVVRRLADWRDRQASS